MNTVLLLMDFQHGVVESIDSDGVVDAASKAVQAARNERRRRDVRESRLP
jgi:hypothetical protein